MARLIPFLLIALIAVAADLPSRKYLNLAAVKTMAAAAEAEMQKHNVQVTICIVDESGNLLFLQKADNAALTTIQFAQRKARQAALYRCRRNGRRMRSLASIWRCWRFSIRSPTRARFRLSRRTDHRRSCSGAPSEVDEAISQFAADTLLKK